MEKPDKQEQTQITAVPTHSGSVCRKTSQLLKIGVSLIACSVGFASLQSQLFVPLHRATA
jgi:hypothetical protein